MINIVNPLLSIKNSLQPQGVYKFTASFKDDEWRSQDARVVRLILNNMKGVDADGIEMKYDMPITFAGVEKASGLQGVDSITNRTASDATKRDYPTGHIEITTKNPLALLALLKTSLEGEIGTKDMAALQDAITSGLGPNRL